MAVDLNLYTAWDVETTYGTYLGRAGSPFCNHHGLCSSGSVDHHGVYDDAYCVQTDAEGVNTGVRPGHQEWIYAFPCLDTADVLVGANIKFDLLWMWRHPELEAFLKRGGVIWDILYAEYLLTGTFCNLKQLPFLRPSLDNLSKKYGGEGKLDVVKALWDTGVRTEDIDPEVLLEYQKADVIDTAMVYRAQIAKAKRQNQTHMILGRMEGLLATTEMEYNGLNIDTTKAAELQKELEATIEGLVEDLNQHIPKGLPPELEFKWTSPKQLSALLFGGKIKYSARVVKYNDDGTPQYFKKKSKELVLDSKGRPDVFKGGKNKGKIKTRQISVDDIDRGPKTRLEDKWHTLPRQVEPSTRYRCKDWCPDTNDYYSVGEAVIKKLDSPIIKSLIALKQKEKDLGTYFSRYVKGKKTGMLTMVGEDQILHHSLNHFITVTTRLASSKPNLQNIPHQGKSKVRQVFTSRFGDEGAMVEGDYSQLEVVCKGVLSGDEGLLNALQAGICFHCEWLSFTPIAANLSYEDIFKLVKVDKNEEWIAHRSRVKPLTFGEAYGAQPKSLAQNTGMTIEDVEEAIENRKKKYPKLYAYDDTNVEKVKNSRKPSVARTTEGYTAGIGYLRIATDTIFHFLETDNPEWMQKKGDYTGFELPQVKNYPSQGLGGEIMQVQSGRVFRWLLSNNRFDNTVLLVNTVHDCMWVDCKKSSLHHLKEMKVIMEDVCAYFNENYPSVNWDTPFPTEFDYGPDVYKMNHLDLEETH